MSKREIAARVKKARELCEFTQEFSASQILKDNGEPITQQQLYKMESGQVHISADRLLTMADVYGVDITFFYRDHEIDDEIDFIVRDLREMSHGKVTFIGAVTKALGKYL